ncbi:MAG: right-handed parallel beta-helix repeat-containing protein [Candidatus Marinimicrobia bacterium]|nr:right-handed parallel beta-helix repeat-containing protein [Candidatus Neomarinimicrobiota bacterium]
MPIIEEKPIEDTRMKLFTYLRDLFDKIGIKIIKAAMRSYNFVSGSSGWEIKADGDVEFNSGIFRGQLQVGGLLINVSTSDDIQTAIDLVNSAGGGSVNLGSGTHKPGKNLVLYNGVYLQGVSASKTIIDFEFGAYQIQILGSNNYSTGTVTVANNSTTVEGSGTTWTSAMAGRYILLAGIWYLIASVTDSDTLVLALPYGGKALSGDSYVIATTVNDVKITDMTIKNSTASALIKEQYANEVFYQDVDLQVAPVFIDVDDSSNTTFNYVDMAYSVASDGIQCNNVHFSFFLGSGGIDFGVGGTGNGITLNGCTNISLNTDFLLNATGDGINLTDCDNIGILTSNCTENGGQGIELVSGCTNISIINTGCFANGSDGIKLTATDDRNIISGCLLDDNGGYGVNIANANCDDNVVKTNSYYNNTSGNINDAGTGTVKTGAEIYELIASNNLKVSADTERTERYTNFVKVKDITVNTDGTIKVKFDLKSNGGGYVAYGRIYVNGVAVGTERITNETTYQNYSEDITISKGDEVQLYIRSGTAPVYAYIENFRLYWDKVVVAEYTVNTD